MHIQFLRYELLSIRNLHFGEWDGAKHFSKQRSEKDSSLGVLTSDSEYIKELVLPLAFPQL